MDSIKNIFIECLDDESICYCDKENYIQDKFSDVLNAVEATVSKRINPLIKALEEIAEGAGPYSRDPLTHAENTIEAMKEIAKNALDET